MADASKTILVNFESNTSGAVANNKQLADSFDDVADATKKAEEAAKKQAETAKKAAEEQKGAMGSLKDEIKATIPGFDKLKAGWEKGGKASKAFGLTTKQALIATGLGAFIVLIGSVVSLGSVM